ncbi:PREDICTED: ATP-dependent DNA helicase Q-like 3 [Amphimedon queenslandica]|uniref:DEAD/DEAH box helicase domain-containing protein n=1 Tax=Amphimedon queenslandica TaxID=400682 RepID=A0AAN0IPD2_AMPQE|nr:PREDICTED: ATP-dependent DNA helicase Q-like 3 [Amphimedon queenslandica]|eukprot:XP_011406292.1 PREDICTED: ATP-dependent DNA helicase Q-like 3 [Amphimedon queenslandica]
MSLPAADSLLLAEAKVGITLKDKQREAVLAVLQNKDVFCVLPTGCDQQSNFTSKGICVEYVGEIQHDQDVIKNIVSGNVPLILISPENITCNPLYRGMLHNNVFKDNMVVLPIGEAHCVKTWGDYFQTTLAEFGHIGSSLPSVPVIAATATATKTTFESVVKSLLMEIVVVIGISSCRNNIFLTVTSVSLNCNFVYDKIELFLDLYLIYAPGKSIVCQYCLLDLYTRASTEDVEKSPSCICEREFTN